MRKIFILVIILLIFSALLEAKGRNHYFFKMGYGEVLVDNAHYPILPLSFLFMNDNMYEGSMGVGGSVWLPYFENSNYYAKDFYMGAEIEALYTVAQYDEGFTVNLSMNMASLVANKLTEDLSYSLESSDVYYGFGAQVNTPFLHYLEIGLSVKYSYLLKLDLTGGLHLVHLQIIFNAT